MKTESMRHELTDCHSLISLGAGVACRVPLNTMKLKLKVSTSTVPSVVCEIAHATSKCLCEMLWEGALIKLRKTSSLGHATPVTWWTASPATGASELQVQWAILFQKDTKESDWRHPRLASDLHTHTQRNVHVRVPQCTYTPKGKCTMTQEQDGLKGINALYNTNTSGWNRQGSNSCFKGLYPPYVNSKSKNSFCT